MINSIRYLSVIDYFNANYEQTDDLWWGDVSYHLTKEDNHE